MRWQSDAKITEIAVYLYIILRPWAKLQDEQINMQYKFEDVYYSDFRYRPFKINLFSAKKVILKEFYKLNSSI